MMPIKAFLVLGILVAAIAAGTAIYTVYEDDNFSAQIRLLSARADGNDILVDVELRLDNKMDAGVVLRNLRVTIMDSSRTITFVSEVIVPPYIAVAANSITVKHINDVRIENAEAIGTTVIGIVDIEWQSGAEKFSLHREMPINIGSIA